MAKVAWGWLIAGAVAGGVAMVYAAKKVQIPNAYALGQQNPTLPYANLSAAQVAQLNTNPPLQSPPTTSQYMAATATSLSNAIPTSTNTQQTASAGFARGAFGNILVQ